MSTQTQSINASDSEEWNEASPEQRQQALGEAWEDLHGSSSTAPAVAGSEADYSQYDSARAAIEAQLTQTWQAEVLGGITVELYQLTESQIQQVRDLLKLFLEVEQAGDVEDLDESLLEDLDETDARLNRMLGGDPDLAQEVEDDPERSVESVPQARGIVADSGMDFAYFQSGDYPPELRMQLFRAVLERYQDQMGQIRSFRGGQ